MSIGLTSVKEKKESKSAKIIKDYNLNVRYQYEPTGWITKNLPLLVAPIFSSTFVFIIITLVIAYLTLSNSSLAHLTGDEKGKLVANISFMLLAPNVFIHYLLNSLIVYPVARFKKFKTSKSNFLLILLNIFMVLSIILYFATTHLNQSIISNNNISNVFLPSYLFISGALITFMYRNFNELYKRDKEGNIVMKQFPVLNVNDNKETVKSNKKNQMLK